MNIVPQLTTAGQSLLITALSGGSINFTKIVVGDGAAPSSQSSLTNLVNPLIEMSIETFSKGDNYVRITGSFTNDDVTTGFYWKETGIFAEDGDGNEVMYAYCHTGDLYEYIPSNDSGKSVDTEISVMVAVDDAENVTATIDDNGSYALKKDLQDHIDDTNNPHGVTLKQLGAGDAASKGVDTTVTSGSSNLPTSGAVYTAIENAKTTVDTALSTSSSNPVANSAITTALAGKSSTSHIHSLWDVTVPINITCTKSEITTGGEEVAPNEGALEAVYETDVVLSKASFKALYEWACDEGYSLPDGISLSSVTAIGYSDDDTSADVGEANGYSDSRYFILVSVEDDIVQSITIYTGGNYTSVAEGDTENWTPSLEIFKSTMFS